MAYYLYVPFKKKEIPDNQNKILEEWIKLEQAKNKEVIVCFAGEKKLNELPANAKIGVLLSGKPGKPSVIHGVEHVPTETLRHHPNLSNHLKVTDEKHNSILIPEIADQMMADGLLEKFTGRLQIKLFFLDTAAKEARVMTNAFLNSLKKDARHQNGTVRLDYHPYQPPINPKPTITYRTQTSKSKIALFNEQADKNKYSLYSNKDNYPKLSLQDVKAAIKSYKKYKESRFCGLSGLLGLNGFFSSEASFQAIKYLTNKSISETDRFDYASRFLKQFKDNHLSQCLKSKIDTSLNTNEFLWNRESTSNITFSAKN